MNQRGLDVGEEVRARPAGPIGSRFRGQGGATGATGRRGALRPASWRYRADWIPAYAGMTTEGRRQHYCPRLPAEDLADGAGEAGEDVVSVEGVALVERNDRAAVAVNVDEALLRADDPDEAERAQSGSRAIRPLRAPPLPLYDERMRDSLPNPTPSRPDAAARGARAQNRSKPLIKGSKRAHFGSIRAQNGSPPNRNLGVNHGQMTRNDPSPGRNPARFAQAPRPRPAPNP